MANISLIEIAKRYDNAAAIAVAEELNEQSVLMRFLDFEEVSGGTKKFGARAKLPSVGWRHINGTITQDYSVVNRFEESCKIMESNPSIDAGITYANPAMALADETLTHVEAMAQEFDDEFFYGDITVDDAGFDGLYSRIISSGTQFVDCTSSGSVTSIYACRFGRGQVRGIVPDGGQFMESYSLGRYKDQTLGIVVLGSHVMVKAGYYINNGRAVAQLGNVGTTVGTKNPTPTMLHQLVTAVKGGPTALFCSNTGLLQIQYTLENSLGTQLASGLDSVGRLVYQWGGIPIYVTDAVSDAETAK